MPFKEHLKTILQLKFFTQHWDRECSKVVQQCLMGQFLKQVQDDGTSQVFF